VNLDADFATWDIQANGGHLAFSQGNSVVAPQVVGTDAHRAVRSTAPARANASSTVEFIFWSPDGSNPSLAPVSGVPPLCYGVGNGSATLNDWVGFDANAWGYCGDGKVRNNNIVVADYSSFGLPANGDKVGITVDMRDISAPTLTIRKGGRLLGTITLPAGAAYYYMGTISGDPEAIALLGNSGTTRQYYAIDDGGWSLPIDSIAPVLIASEPYMTAATDSPRHEKYSGDLDTINRPLSINDGISFWMDGPSAPAELHQGGGLVQFQVNDPDADENTPNIYLELCTSAARNVPVYFLRNTFDGAIAGAEFHYAGVLDHAEPDSLKTIQVYVRGMESLLSKPLFRTQFAPSEANQSVRLLSMPIAFGVIRNHTGTVVNSATDERVLHDAAITGFGESRSAGLLMVYGGDFAQTPDGSGVTFAQVTPGIKTFETTSFGGSFNPAAIDYFAACGDFTTAVPYVGAGADHGYPNAGGVQWHGSYFLPAGAPFQLVTIGGHTYLRAQNVADGYAWFYQTVHKARAGYTYTFKIYVHEIPYFGAGSPENAPPAQLLLTYYKDVNGSFNPIVRLTLDHTGLYTGFFVNTSGIDQDVVFFYNSNNVVSTTQYFGVDGIVFDELPPTGQVVDLPGPGLTQMVTAFAVDRGPLEAYQVATADTDAIDAATGYIYGIRVSETENPSCAEILQSSDLTRPSILNSCTAGRYGSPDFKLRVLRLFKPEDIDDGDIDFVLTRSDFLDELIQLPDFAENLTARAQGRRNWYRYQSSDFGENALSQVPQITRLQLQADYQWTVTTNIKLARRYREALLRDPIPTLLDRIEHGQDFIDHACGPFADDRNFYARARVLMPFGRNFQIGQVGLVNHPNVTGGMKKLMVRGFSPKQTQAEQPNARPIFWGL
jgi:hypothetical protein